MALPSVQIQYQNGGLGLVANPDDRVVGLIVNGVGFQNTPFLAPQQLFSLADFDAWVATNNMVGEYPNFARVQVADFYSLAGTGAELWVMFVVNTVPTPDIFTNGQVAALLDAADGRLNVVAVSRYNPNETQTPTLVDGVIAETINAMDEAQALAVDYASRYKPVRFILDGRWFSGDTAALHNLKSHTFNRVAVCLASTSTTDKSACLGLLLGRIASIPVNVNIGRVSDGEMPKSDAYLTNGQTVKSFGTKAIATNDKGYIFLRQHVSRAGFYWNDSHMATSDTDDYFSLENGRVIDKAARIAYATFLDNLLATVTVDDKGKIVKTTLKQYQAEIERAVSLSMGVPGEISGVQAFIDPNQDVLATGRIVVDLRVTPTGTNRTLVIRLGLYNPNA